MDLCSIIMERCSITTERVLDHVGGRVYSITIGGLLNFDEGLANHAGGLPKYDAGLLSHKGGLLNYNRNPAQ